MSTAKVVAIIQARMGSSRLPGKVLEPIAGTPMLGHVVRRARRIDGVHDIVVATSTATTDDAVVTWCREQDVSVVRGDEDDVLDRFRKVLETWNSATVVRLTADCPMIDPGVSKRVLDAFIDAGPDYASNTLRPTYPDGLDTEVVRREALATAWTEAELLSEREHVTPFVWTRPSRFDILSVEREPDLSHHRWTVDEPEDLAFVRRIFEILGDRVFGMDEVLETLEDRPGLVEMNSDYDRNEGYEASVEEDEALLEGGG